MKQKQRKQVFYVISLAVFVSMAVVRLWMEYLSHIAKMQWQIEGNLLLHRNHVIKHNRKAFIIASLRLSLPRFWPLEPHGPPASHRHTQANGWVSAKQFRHSISAVLGLAL